MNKKYSRNYTRPVSVRLPTDLLEKLKQERNKSLNTIVIEKLRQAELYSEIIDKQQKILEKQETILNKLYLLENYKKLNRFFNLFRKKVRENS